jgi:hypothetical protein
LATSLTVRKLVGRVLEGAVRVPEFQRPLRWSGKDVTTLFDSILKGYPIGALLFWKQRLPAGPALVGRKRMEFPQVDEGWWIVDGQQRVTALAATLAEGLSEGDPRWDIFFDPEGNRFFLRSEGEVIPGRHVSLKALGDIRRLGRWFRDGCELSEREQDHVEGVQQRILDYEIPAYVMDTDDENALRGVFARLNSTGVRMRADEVFQALLGAGTTAPGAPRRRDLDALQVAADVDGFGQPPRAEVLKALMAMSNLDPSRRMEELTEEQVSRLVSVEDAEESIQRAVWFLQASHDASVPGCGIPAYAFLPYPVVFVLLARWFHVFPEPGVAVRRALSRWVWRGILTGVHQRAEVSAMRLQLRKIEGRQEDAIRDLLQSVGEPDSREWKLAPFRARNAASRVETLALLSLEPRAPDGPVSWRALLTSNEHVARGVFALSELPPEEQKLGKTVANRVLLDAKHSKLITVLREWRWPEDREALESHLIDASMLEDLRQERRLSFLQKRATRVRGLVARFLADRAGSHLPVVLPLDAYTEVG